MCKPFQSCMLSVWSLHRGIVQKPCHASDLAATLWSKPRPAWARRAEWGRWANMYKPLCNSTRREKLQLVTAILQWFHQDNQFTFFNVLCDLFPLHLYCQEHPLLGMSHSFEGSFLTSMCFKRGRDNFLLEEGKKMRDLPEQNIYQMKRSPVWGRYVGKGSSPLICEKCQQNCFCSCTLGLTHSLFIVPFPFFYRTVNWL